MKPCENKNKKIKFYRNKVEQDSCCKRKTGS